MEEVLRAEVECLRRELKQAEEKILEQQEYIENLEKQLRDIKNMNNL